MFAKILTPQLPSLLSLVWKENLCRIWSNKLPCLAHSNRRISEQRVSAVQENLRDIGDIESRCRPLIVQTNAAAAKS